MNAIRFPLFTFLVALLAAAIAAPARAADEKKASDTPLGKAMDDLGKAVKALRKSVKDKAKNEESLKLVDVAEKASIESKKYPPAMLEKVPEAKKAEVMAGYLKAMDDVIAELAKLKQQLKDGKNEDAVETVKNLKTIEEEGHEKYNP